MRRLKNSRFLCKCFEIHKSNKIFIKRFLFLCVIPDLSGSRVRKGHHGFTSLLYSSQRGLQMVWWAPKIKGESLSFTFWIMNWINTFHLQPASHFYYSLVLFCEIYLFKMQLVTRLWVGASTTLCSRQVLLTCLSDCFRLTWTLANTMPYNAQISVALRYHESWWMIT